MSKVVDLYSAQSWETHLWSAQVWTTQFLHCKHTPYLPWPRKCSPDGATSVVTATLWLQLNIHLSTSRGWKAELADIQRTVYPLNGYPSAAGMVKFASQRPSCYHWVTPLTHALWSFMAATTPDAWCASNSKCWPLTFQLCDLDSWSSTVCGTEGIATIHTSLCAWALRPDHLHL